MIDALLHALATSNLPLTDEEFADVLWLASYMDMQSNASTLVSAPEVKSPPATPADAQNHPQQPTKDQQAASTYGQPTTSAQAEVHLPKSSTHDKQRVEGMRALSFRSPAATALPGKLALARALRPILRKIPSSTQQELDEVATAEQAAEEGRIAPQLRPGRERWLDVAIVIDDWHTMAIWQQTIAEFIELLQQLGAFRTLQTYLLSTKGDGQTEQATLQLFTAQGFKRGRICPPGELVDPRGRRLTLVLTDCTSPAWSSGAAGNLLSQWGSCNMVTLVQMLPADLWNSCALADAIQIAVSAPAPGSHNTKLVVELPWYWDDIWDKNDPTITLGTPVPVVTLEPEALLRWIKMMRGKGGTTTAAFYLPIQPTGASKPNGKENFENLSPEEHWRHFRATASPMAQELAGYLSAAPLSLPVMRLVQRVMMPQSRQVHLAEILRSSLVKCVIPTKAILDLNTVLYEFDVQIRELLLTSVLISDTKKVLEKVSEFVSSQNYQLRNFHALILDPTTPGDFVLDKNSLPLARVASIVLGRFGGNYTHFVERLETALLATEWEYEETSLVDKLQEILAIEENSKRIELFSSIVSSLTREEFASGLHSIIEIEDEGLRATRLSMFAPHLPMDLLTEALSIARGIIDNTSRFIAIVALVPFITEEMKSVVLSELLPIALSIADPQDRALMLAALIPHLPVVQLWEVLDTAWKTAIAIANFDVRRRAFAALLPYTQNIFDTLVKISHEDVAPLYHEIPQLPTNFTGRETIVDDIANALIRGNGGVISIVGGGGIGKTAIATAVANHPTILAHFRHGVLWVTGGANTDLLALTAQMSSALSIDVSQHITIDDRISIIHEVIDNRYILLIIDDVWNIETAQLVRCGGPNSSHLLIARSERMARAYADQEIFVISSLANTHAYDLLKNIAPDFCSIAPDIAHKLINAVNGLPLALKLLGGHLATGNFHLYPDLANNILADLETRKQRIPLKPEEMGNSDFNVLQAAIHLSIEALPEEVVSIFYKLTVFAAQPASFDLAAAKAVADADTDTLNLLISRGFLEYIADNRFALHQVLTDEVRKHQSRKQQVMTGFRDYYLNLANKNSDDWQQIGSNYQQIQWAWQQQMNSDPDNEVVLQFVWSLSSYHARRGLWREKLSWVEHALTVAKKLNQPNHIISMLSHIGVTHSTLGNKNEALSYYKQSLPLCRQIGDKVSEATALNNIGAIYDDQGEADQALDYYRQALMLYRSVGDRSGEATILNNIGIVQGSLGDRKQALAYYEQALPIYRSINDRSSEATTLNNIGSVYDSLGEKQRALAYYEQALPLYRSIGDRNGEATTLNNLGLIYSALGDLRHSLDYFEQSLSIYLEIDNIAMQAAILNNIGNIYDNLADKQKAIDYFEKALVLRRRIADATGQSTSLNNIGTVYAALGQGDKAISYLQEALSSLKQSSDSVRIANTLSNLGLVYLSSHKYEQAIDIFQQALHLCQQVGDKSSESTVRGYLNRVNVLANQKADTTFLGQINTGGGDYVGRDKSGSDIIVGTVGSGARNVAIGKNITQTIHKGLTVDNVEVEHVSLLELLHHTDSRVRWNAATQIIAIADEQDWGALQNAFQTETESKLRGFLYEQLAENPINRSFLMNEYATNFVRAIEVAPEERAQSLEMVEALHNNLATMETLQNRYAKTILFGSLARNTAVKFTSDIDVLVVFYDQNKEEPRTVYKFLQSVLNVIYASRIPSRSNRGKEYGKLRNLSFKGSVLVNLSNRVIEVLPAVYAHDKNRTILIPNIPRSTWEPNNYEFHTEFAEEQNKVSGGLYSDLVKAAKWWQLYQAPKRRYLSGFILECLIAATTKDWYNESLLSAFEKVLREMRKQYSTLDSLKYVPEPVTAARRLKNQRQPYQKATGLNAQRYSDFMKAVSKTIALIEKAKKADSIDSEVLIWQQIFGPEFPRTIGS